MLRAASAAPTAAAAATHRAHCRPAGHMRQGDAPRAPAAAGGAASAEGREALARLGGGALRALLFDVDGTLVDSDPLHMAVFRDMFLRHGAKEECTEALFKRSISGRHNPDIVKDFFPHKSDEEAVEFVAEKEAAFRALAVSSLGPIAGLASLVSAADDRGLRRAAVTNAPRANASQLIAAAGVGEWIGSNLIVGDELPEAKPSPLPYLRACELLDVNPAQAIVCEDSRSGIAAAVAAGICCVGITTSLDAEELLRLGCAAAVDDYAQLLQLLGWKAE